MSGTTVSVDQSGALVLDDTGDHVTIDPAGGVVTPKPAPPPHQGSRPHTPSPRDLWLAGEIRRRTALELAVRISPQGALPSWVVREAATFEAYLAGGEDR